MRASLWLSLSFALLLGALSGLVMLPAAQHLRSLHNGQRAEATLETSGPCMTGGCKVSFEAEGRTVVAGLPVGSGGRSSRIGTRLDVRHQADDPQVVAREEDVSGGGAAVLAVVSGAAALLFAVLSVWSAVFMRRQRRAEPVRPSAHG
ncbi:DUF3592 domain-containing protein [Streptomyces sp. NPDC058664]|uniref:DUF3592 domain-containing protein n=1 Tax=unclassified Streptomyces TaxID=2593676 RepID=UPI00364AB623